MMTYDAIVIGGGHNGLVAAAYLGKAGHKTLVLERRPVLGGAAVTEEFHPGYRNSIASYTLGLLRGEIIRDLDLKRHGLTPLPYTGALKLLSDGRQVMLTGDAAHDQAAIGRYSNRDYDGMVAFFKRLERLGDVVRTQWLKPPPAMAGGMDALFSSLSLAGKLRGLDEDDRHLLAKMLTSTAWDVMSRAFESPTMRQIFAGHCVSGNYASLHAPGSALVFFLNGVGELDGKRNKWGIAKGGMGAVSEAIAAAARSHGVETRTSAPVAKILVERGRAVGVRLESGEEIRARVVLSNADPKRTLLGFVGEEHLEPRFAADIENIRVGHASFRMNLALAGTPAFKNLTTEEERLARGASITIIPTVESLERTYQASQNGEITDDPFINVQIASALDPGLAPPGHHVMSLLAKYYPYRLSRGRHWDDAKEACADAIVDTVAKHIPNLKSLIVGRQVLSPLDLERVFGLPEGDIFHGRHDLDQIFSLRMHPKAAQYAMPVAGLYLCGSGTHPGGGVSGAPGHNAAKRAIRDMKRRAA
jgi:phytoene dehydrogenase-like protein